MWHNVRYRTTCQELAFLIDTYLYIVACLFQVLFYRRRSCVLYKVALKLIQWEVSLQVENATAFSIHCHKFLSAINPLLSSEAIASFPDNACLSGPTLKKYSFSFCWIMLGGSSSASKRFVIFEIAAFLYCSLKSVGIPVVYSPKINAYSSLKWL